MKVLHEELLGNALGISDEAVREQKHIEYVRGLDAAYAKVRDRRGTDRFSVGARNHCSKWRMWRSRAA